MNQLEILLQHPFVMQRIKEERKKQGYDESLEPCLDEDGDIMFKDNASLSGFSWVLSTEGFDVWEKLFIYKDMSQFYRFYGLPEPKTINILNPIDASEARNSFIGEEKLPITPLSPINEVYQMIHENMKTCTEIECRVQLSTIEIKLLELRKYKVEIIGDRVKVSW